MSMWIVSPVTGWRAISLTTTGVAAIAVDAQLEHRAGVGERVAQHPCVDVERDRVLATAIDARRARCPSRRSRRAARDPAGSRRSTASAVVCAVAMTVSDGSDTSEAAPTHQRRGAGPSTPPRKPRRRPVNRSDSAPTDQPGVGCGERVAGPLHPPQRRAKLDFMSGDAQLMLMIAGMHLLGLVCAAVLIMPALRDSPGVPAAPPRSGLGRRLGPRSRPPAEAARSTARRHPAPRRRAGRGFGCAITAR